MDDHVHAGERGGFEDREQVPRDVRDPPGTVGPGPAREHGDRVPGRRRPRDDHPPEYPGSTGDEDAALRVCHGVPIRKVNESYPKVNE
ncbi:hypothetical protein GCM10023147_16050 [Tsukamurella soli]|uniref:Uncharacterized protein n=1 Tax=Tsukamurella soli TaxID=644556 RepID=A0ABP8JE72_9ACTN